MPNIRYQVFVSSTWADLQEERKAVTWTLLKARHIPVGMESFPATDDRGWDIIRRSIDESDYYVLILAQRYGSTKGVPDGKSWTHREYLYAKEKGIPVLAFLLDEEVPRKAKHTEATESGKEALTNFKAEVSEHHKWNIWSNKDQLCQEVLLAVTAAIAIDADSENARPGWYRGDQVSVDPRVGEELARVVRERDELAARLAGRGSAVHVIVDHETMEDGDHRVDLPVVVPRRRDAVGERAKEEGDARVDEVRRRGMLRLVLRNDGAPISDSRVSIVAEGIDGWDTFDSGFFAVFGPDQSDPVLESTERGIRRILKLRGPALRAGESASLPVVPVVFPRSDEAYRFRVEVHADRHTAHEFNLVPVESGEELYYDYPEHQLSNNPDAITRLGVGSVFPRGRDGE